ncbi:hypothetical protein HYY75_03855, partial [bacterium]|nr:hypothetical protein [bacterium]
KKESFAEACKDLREAVKLGVAVEDIRFPLAEALAGNKQFHLAYSLGSKHPKLNGQKDRKFLFRCYFHSFPITYILGILSVFVCFGAWFWFFQGVAHFAVTRSFKLLFETITFLTSACLLGVLGSSNKLLKLADAWETSWFKYIAGLACIRDEKWELGESCLQAAVKSLALEARSLFFLGFVRKKLNRISPEKDLEHAIYLAIQKRPPTWFPAFLRKLESEAAMKIKVQVVFDDSIIPVAWDMASMLKIDVNK